MSSTRRQLEDQLVDFSRRVHGRSWVANHDGNLTVRLTDDRWLATPTGVSKLAVCREELVVVDGHGKRVSGRAKPFSELVLHLCIYRRRPDVAAVIHAHPPTATGLAVAGVELQPTMMPEPVVSLGDRIPLVPYAAPKSAEFTVSLLPFVDSVDALVLEHHGVLTFGPDLETAYLRMELVEHLAKIQLVAMQAGGVRAIPAGDVRALLDARRALGLVPVPSPGLPEASDLPEAGRGCPSPEVTAIVVEELQRELTRRTGTSPRG